MAGYRQSAAEMEVQEYLAKAQAGLAGVNPKAQTLARSSGNPQAQAAGQELVARQLQENAARREAVAAERARQQAQAAEQRRQEELQLRELRRQEQARAQAERDAELQRRADQLGAVTIRNPQTGALEVQKHADGANAFTPGPVGEPRAVTKVIRDTQIVDAANPGQPIPTWQPLGDDGGVLGATTFADYQAEEEWQQQYRDERGNLSWVKLEKKTDPRTAETYYEKPSKMADGAPERVVTGIDRRVKRLREMDRDGEALAVRRNGVLERQRIRAEEQAPLQAEYESARQELEALRGNGWRVAGGDHGPTFWVRQDAQGNRLPDPTPAEVQAHERAGSAARKRFVAAKRALEARRPEDEELAGLKAQHEEEANDLARRRAQVDKGQPEISREQAEWAAQMEKRQREDEAEAKRLAAIQPPEPPKLMDVSKSPAANDPDGRATVALAFGPSAMSSDLSAEATKYSGFHINRGTQWIANVEKNGAIPVITLYEAEGDEDRLREQAILHGTNGVPLYLRHNAKRKPIEKEAEEIRKIYEIYRTPPAPGESEAEAAQRKRKELEQLGGLRSQVIERTRRGEISLDHGEALMRDFYGGTLKPVDPRSPRVFQMWLDELAPDEVRDLWKKDEHDVKARNAVRNQFVNWWYATNSELPGVTRGMQARLRRELTSEESEGFDENFTAVKKGSKSVGSNLVGSVIGLGLGVQEHIIQTPLSWFNEDVAKQEAELRRIQGRDGKNFLRGFGKNLEKYFTNEGSQERGDLIRALMDLKESIDRSDAEEHYGYTDTPEKEAAARKAALQAVRDKAYAMHARWQEDGFAIRPEDVDPEQDPVLKRALDEYQVTGDPAMWKIFERRLQQDRGNREHEDDMADLTEGLDEFNAAIMSGVYAGPQELGIEALSWAAGGLGKVAKAARAATMEARLTALASRGGRMGEVATQLLRGQRMLGRINGGRRVAGTAGKSLAAVPEPFWKRLAKASMDEAGEEMATEFGNPEMTPGSMIEAGAMGAIGAPLLKPVTRVTGAPARIMTGWAGDVAGWVRDVVRGKKAAEFADWHNRGMADTPGFQPLTEEDAAAAIETADAEELERLAEEHRDALQKLAEAEAEAKSEARTETAGIQADTGSGWTNDSSTDLTPSSPEWKAKPLEADDAARREGDGAPPGSAALARRQTDSPIADDAQAARGPMAAGSGPDHEASIPSPSRPADPSAIALRSGDAAALVRRLPATGAEVEAAAMAPDAKQRLGEVKAGTVHALEAYRFLSAKRQKTGGLSPAEQVTFERATQALAETVGREKQVQAGAAGAGDRGNRKVTSIFREPELPMSNGRPVMVPEELFVNLIRDMDHPHAHGTAKKWNSFEGHSEALVKAALHHEARIANHAREHGVILDENGIPTWQGIGEPGMLPVPEGEAKGKTLIHNHPKDSPPGWEDLIEACEQDAALLRIPTKNEVFSVVLIDRNPATYRFLRTSFQDIGDGTGTEWMRRQGSYDKGEMSKLMQHAVMVELDRRGLLKYQREWR